MIDPSSTDAAIHSFVPLATACLPDLYTLNYSSATCLSLSPRDLRVALQKFHRSPPSALHCITITTIPILHTYLY